MNKEEFINKLGINNNDIIEKLDIYYNFLNEYNKHTNLTAIVNEEDVYLKHFYDSIIINQYIDIDNKKIIDIGTGAGFPGVVLKIFYPNIELTLLDSNNKKTTFLKELLDKLNIKDVTIVNDRAEEYSKNHLNEFDICISRAVAFIDIIASLSLPLIKKEGSVVLMKGKLDKELEILKNHKDEIGIFKYEIINYQLPNNDERNLVILKKNKDTVNILNYSQIKKRNSKWM